MSRELENVVWHALNGPCAHLGTVHGHAARFDPDVAPFAAICDDACEQGWADLATLVGPGHATVLFRPRGELPEGWTVEHSIPCVQMVATSIEAAADERFTPLRTEDVAEMLELVAETQPGPFGTRTIEFGGYVGLRESGRLVAMAGERLRCDGFAEVSAVCTRSSHRTRGLGTALVRTVVSGIRSRGEEAFLHASATNEKAIRLYRALGFTVSLEPDAYIVRAPKER